MAKSLRARDGGLSVDLPYLTTGVDGKVAMPYGEKRNQRRVFSLEYFLIKK